ncbi:hypothetical protein G3I40_05765 [Streptomyces sp. SID14478]|uniref:hypothetical protein n=1 Tax=Streptomyces sp. SID14478 TaxID=2706073 RepID=UPI0013DCD47B|nr:hypothetical protein [Streptomyces sp. SID14478]NEB74738.1 hypothetical protein [Streptomyces sp. SID14478]
MDDATVLVRLLRTDLHAADAFLGSAQVLQLDDEVHGPLREGIAARLGSRVDVLIAPLAAPPGASGR